MSKTEEIREKKNNIVVRPPVVVVVGHIDHGKSTLIEKIKDIKITEKESGGITQHIGAYEVEKDGKKITFIDTPGHEAFSAMRQRGAKVADIAILVVDAAEGVKAQTKEAINFVKKAGISMVVALNKIDKPQAQPEKVKQELSKEGILVESFGGKIPAVNVSAKTGKGINELLETILLVAEIEDLKTDISKPATGTVIESYLDSKKGLIATLILEQGILRVGDIVATPSVLGKVKRLSSFQKEIINTGFPAQPVIVLGFEEAPGVGEKFRVYKTKARAREALKREKEEITPQVIFAGGGKKVLNIILKVDVLGSSEAIEGILKNIPQEKVILRVLKSEVGDIGVSDIRLAESGKAKIFGFRVKIDEGTKVFAKQKEVRVRIFEVIYDFVQGIRQEMVNILEPEIQRIDLGKFKVTVLFKKGKDGQIIGGKVIEGEITKNTMTEVLRQEEIIGKGKIKNLQQEKKDIGKAVKGKEAGILFQGEVQIEEGDILQIFKEEKEKGTL